jgi:hypothetical protein
MNPNALQELRCRYLLKLYELSEGGLHDEVDLNRLKPQIGMSREEIRSVERYLLDKDLISYKCRVMCVRITTRGIDEVERIMAQTYAAKEFRVLKTIHETKYKAFYDFGGLGGAQGVDWFNRSSCMDCPSRN